jgi:YVTN family beta-propeller protein
MMRLAALFLCLSGLATGVGAQTMSGTLLVANRDGGSISFFDLESGIEMARLPIGARIPHEIAVSPDGRLALTSEYGTADDPGRMLHIIDVASASFVGHIDLGPDSRPHSFAFLPEGRRAVATMEDSDRLALVDVEERTLVGTLPTGGRDGHMVRVSPDGGTAYVTSRGAEGTLSVIDLSGTSPPVVVATGAGAEGLAVAPDGSEVWVVNRRAASISIVDAETLEVIETLEAPPFAGRAEISPAGRVLVPNGTFGEETVQALTLYDLRTRGIIAQHVLRPGRPGRGGFGIHVAGERAFVSDRAARSIAIYDLARFPESRLLSADHDDPDGLSYSAVRLGVLED